MAGTASADARLSRAREDDGAVSALASQASASRWSAQAALAGAWMLALAATPIWLGSNTLAAWGVNALVFGLLAVAIEIVATRANAPLPRGLTPLTIGFLIFLGVVLLQVAPWVPDSLQAPIWKAAEEALNEHGIEGSISVNRDATVIAAMRLMTAAAAFWCALRVGSDARRAETALMVLAIAGAVYAAAGVGNYVLAPDRLLWMERPNGAYAGSVTGPFVNRNNFATYAGMTAILAFALAGQFLRRAMDAAGSRVRSRIAGLIEGVSGRGGLLLVCGFVIVAALFLSASRGGIAASLAGMAVLFGLVLARGSKKPVTIAALALGLLVVVVAFLAYGGAFVARLDEQGVADTTRLATYALTLRSILDAPLLGWGYGTFQDVFPMYRDASLPVIGTWDKAHNSYLELAQGVGIPAAVLLCALVGVIVRRTFRGALRRRRHATIPMAAAAASVLVLLHAVFDFSLQIQAIALTWMALLGLGLAQAESQRRAGPAPGDAHSL